MPYPFPLTHFLDLSARPGRSRSDREQETGGGPHG